MASKGLDVLIRRIKDYLVYLLVRLVICVLQAMRIETCERLARVLAGLANDVLQIRRDVVDDNLRHVYPAWSEQQRSDLARRMWYHLALMACELAHVQRKVHETNWRRYLHLRGKPEMVRYLLDARPLIMVSGHFGNFEIALYGVGLLGVSTFAIARPLDNPFLDRFVNRFRSARGQYLLPTQGTAQQVERVLQSGRKLALLGDQHAGAKGVWVDFLGRPASCHKALALFTLSAGAPMMVAYAKRLDRPLQFEIGVQGIVDPRHLDDALAGVKPLTRWYNRMLEQLILAEPAQYWWLHRRWKSPPARRPKARVRRAPPALDDPAGTGAMRHVA